MRKAIVAVAGVGVVAAAAFLVAPTVWSQGRWADENRERRVLMLDGRGSALGVSVRDHETEGVTISDVDEESPAAKAGIREGDTVVEFDGERVRSARHFARLVQESAPGRTVKATIVRDGARQTVDVTPARGPGRYAGDFVLPSLPSIEGEIERGMRALPRDFAFDFDWEGELPEVSVWQRGRLGARLSPLSDQLAEYFGAKDGVLVSSVEPESVAAKAGLKAGDVITSVNGRQVEAPRDVTEQLRDVQAGKDVELGVLRDRKTMTLKAQIPERRRTPARRPVRPV